MRFVKGVEKFEKYEEFLRKKELVGPPPVIKVKGFPKEFLGVKIWGSGSLVNGVLDVSGSAYSEEPLELKRVDISGRLVCKSDLKAEEISVSGSLYVEGDLKATVLDISGKCEICGKALVSDLIDLSGSLSVGETLEAGRIDLAGRLKALNVKADNCTLAGSLRVMRDVDCNVFELKLNGFSEIGGMLKASSVNVYIEEETVLRIGFFKLFTIRKRRRGLLVARKIVGNYVHLENTKCREVWGRLVEIGPNCVIGNVYYCDKVNVDPSSNVEGKLVQVKEEDVEVQLGGH